MDGRGVGSCVMFGSAPLGPSFSVSPLVKLSVAGRGGARKGGSCVLIPDLVVMAKVGASGSGVLLLLIAERIWEYCSRNSLRYRRSDRILKRKDHCRCLLQTGIPARMGCSDHIHQPHEILRSNRKSGCVASKMEETFMEGDGSSQRSSWYWHCFLILQLLLAYSCFGCCYISSSNLLNSSMASSVDESRQWKSKIGTQKATFLQVDIGSSE
ncbi:hypothetical protein Tco_0490999 [Tanacetum coccineum]